MRKILIVLFVAISYMANAQAPTRIDTLYIRGSISKSEYDILKAQEPEAIKISKHDSLKAAGKITEAEYEILKKKALSESLEKNPDIIYYRTYARQSTGIGVAFVIIGHGLFGATIGTAIQYQQNTSKTKSMLPPILLGVSTAAFTGCGIGLLSTAGKYRRKIREIENSTLK